MNKTIIIGNLTRDPEWRDINPELGCCTFTVAVNRRVKKGDHPEADYFRVTAWRKLGELCASYLEKGRKVMVEGTISAHAYKDNKGEARGTLELTAENVEFLSSRGQAASEPPAADDGGDGFTEVDDDELPFN